MRKIKGLVISGVVVMLSACAPQPPTNNSNMDVTHHAHHHHHDHTPHAGVMAELRHAGNRVGAVELKLHDDKGDLELWLTKDNAGHQPLDIPLGIIINVAFPELEGRSVDLRVRDVQSNKDEDGQANIRANLTNYFIFPGDTGADPSFLVGKSFSSKVIISFEMNGMRYQTQPFLLMPHVH